METSWNFCIASIVACIVGLASGGTFVVTAPKRPYYDTQFTVALTVHDVGYGSDWITLTYKGFPSMQLLHRKIFNNIRVDDVQTWGVVFASSKMAANKDQKVLLEIAGLGVKKRVIFEVADNTGHIFIQTDKPLYTPGQKVKFRIIALDEYQRMATYPLKVEIKNPHSVIVDRLRYYPKDAFKAQEMELPREATLGNWTLTATYEDLGGQVNKIYSRIFEVREYVLPRFTTSIDVNPKLITDETELVTITVSSKYLSGRTLKGLVEMRLGIWFPEHDTTFKLEEEYLEELKRGRLERTINITSLFPEGLIDEERKHLSVNVTVTEWGTLETDTVTDESAVIIKPFYWASFEGSKTRFRPGFPYVLQVRVTDAADNVAGNVNLNVEITFKDSERVATDTRHTPATTDMSGNVVLELQTPPNGHKMNVRVTLKDQGMGEMLGSELEVPVMPGVDGQYLQISVVKPVTDQDNGILHLQYTKPQTASVINILFLSRGRLLYATSVDQDSMGESFVEIPSLLYKEGLPFMRIVGYYYFLNNFRKEFVTDSIRLPFKEECKQELRLYKDFRFMRPQKPKAKITISAKGAPDMLVGLVAVDKAVFALTSDQGLTRGSVFAELASHDQGSTRHEHDGHSHFEDVDYTKMNGLVQIVLETGLLRSLSDSQTGIKLTAFDEFEPVQSPTPPTPKEVAKPKPQNVRRYFPESWLFEEHTLSSTGRLRLGVTLPDSITTWSMMAVGVSPTGGVCVTRPLEQRVQKLFYAELRFPFKVTRLEEVKIKVMVFNHHTYDVMANVVVKGSVDLCLPNNKEANTGGGNNSTHFNVTIGADSSFTHVIKVIPLRSGSPALTVEIKNANEEDIVERKLYVVAEGQKMRKTLTFVLDPEAKHATFGKENKGRNVLINTRTIKSSIFNHTKQQTKLNLAMPKEYIKGTESCRISAFGDIMGDVINYAVVKSKSLMDHSLRDAEEVIGDLGPTVHVLLYANKTGLISEELKAKGKQFISHSILRLLNYRDGFAFRLTEKSPKATWLTVVALKTLCNAAPLAYIDKKALIGEGFSWLLEQADEDGSLYDLDQRLAKDSFEYQILLASEALVATKECQELDTVREANVRPYYVSEGLVTLQGLVSIFLEDNVHLVNDSMVLAKAAYALSRYDPEGEITLEAVKRLSMMAKENKKGHVYWAEEALPNVKRKIPFWYRQGAKASAIEGTAFALMVFLQHGGKNVDAIADWLVTQRNHQGVFVGALDSMAAIQALSVYSAEKHGVKVDLLCKVQAKKVKDFKHSFTFNEKNAIHPQSFSNVPVGDVIDVITKGQGLGQMHVAVEYNVPVDKNARCRYNISIQVKFTEIKFDPFLVDFPLCMYCDVDCPQPEVEPPLPPEFNDTMVEDCLGIPGCNETANSTLDGALEMLIGSLEVEPGSPQSVPFPPPETAASDVPIPQLPTKSLGKAETIVLLEKMHTLGSIEDKKPKKDISKSMASLCIQVCVDYLDAFRTEDAVIEIEMLTGYEPIPSDVARLEEKKGIKRSFYDEEREAVIVRYDQSETDTSCFTFRVVKKEDVKKQTPAIVYIREIGDPVPSCVVEYNAPKGKSLHLFCANPSNINRGECRCFSGLCSACKPSRSDKVQLHHAKEMVCNADIGYQIDIKAVRSVDVWTEFKAQVLSLNKTSPTHKPRNWVILTSPSACPCPLKYATRKEPLYVLTRDVEKMVNQKGNNVYRYLLDEKSVFLSVESATGKKKQWYPQVSHFAMSMAFNGQRQCGRR